MPTRQILDRLILSGKSCNLRMIRPMIRDKFRSSDRYIEGVTQIIFQPEYAKRATSVGACQAEEIRHSGYDPKSAVDRLRRGANYVHFDVDNLFFSLPCSFRLKDSNNELADEVFTWNQPFNQLDESPYGKARSQPEWIEHIQRSTRVFRVDYATDDGKYWGTFDLPRRPAPSRNAASIGGGQVEVGEYQRLVELRPAGQQLPVGSDDDGVTVEDKLVLAADHVDVREHGPGFAGPPLAQLKPHIVLVPLVRRGVRHHQQPGPGRSRHRHRAAVLPQVLADGNGDVHRLAALGRKPEYRQRAAGHEVAELVEYAVVGQVMLCGGDRHLAAVQHGGRVQRRARRHANSRLLASAAVQVTGDDRDAVQSLPGELPGEVMQRANRSIHERPAQRQVLDWIAGQHHFGEDDDPGALLGGPHRPFEHLIAIARQVPYGGVDLSEPYPKLRHQPSLCAVAEPAACQRGPQSR